MKYFVDLANGRNNNFDLIRMIAASAVLLSHSFPILIPNSTEPFVKETGESLGGIAVLAFFSISGFFITKSLENRKTFLDFVVARAFRVFPALFIMLFTTSFVIGPFFSTFGPLDYFSRIDSWTYLPRNVALVGGQQYALPGVFSSRPINGSLWTLRWEISCYALLSIAGLLTITSKKVYIFPVLGLMILLMASAIPSTNIPAQGILKLFSAFFIGSALYVYRETVPQSYLIILFLVAATLLVRGTPFYGFFLISLVSYAAIFFGFVNFPLIKKYNALGDYSYGMYIYSFPTQMCVVSLYHPASPWVLSLISFPVALTFSVISWYLVERPALEQRHFISRSRLREK